MPVEIREIVIRATVEEAASGEGGEEKPAPPGVSPASGPRPGSGAKQRSQLVAECVEAVMEILRERRER